MNSMVKIVDKNGEKVTYVYANDDLIPGTLGIAKLRSQRPDGKYALIHINEYGNCNAELVSDEEALEAIISSGNESLLKTTKYKDLKALWFKPGKKFDKLVLVKRIKPGSGVHIIYLTAKEMAALGLNAYDEVLLTITPLNQSCEDVEAFEETEL